MKNGWQKKQLGELADLKGRIGWRGLTAKEYTESGPLFLSVHSLNYGDYIDFRDAFHISEERYVESPEIMIQEGDVLICKDGAGIGKVGIVGELPDRTTINSSLLLIRSGDSILPKFLYRCLSSPYFQKIVNSRLNGATTPHLYQRDITEFPVVVPPLPEQRRIVGILDEAFEGIATAKANAEKNLQNARALFESHLQSVFTQRGKGWVERSLGEMCERITKGSSPKWQGIAYIDTPGILFVTSENVGEYQILLEQPKYVEEKFNTKDKKSILRAGDVLTNIVGASIGRTAVFDRDDVANINQAVCLIRCESEVLNNFFLTYLLNSPVFKGVLHDNEVDNARANLSLGFFSQLLVPTPPLSEQRKIVAALDSLREETQRLASVYERKLAALEALKKSLLHQAFTGEL
ncbi:MAG: restriction endonuclease subunit S [candidate division NC10 bacterium]|nr:restriction endonuclease subunit S [candidate division NC10 bacterium]MDE2320553.1 restriction endonuclease subunit S [candidate division NC10 bacterium]